MADRITQALTVLVVALLAGVVALAGLGFFAAALYMALATLVPPAGAAALTGVAALVLALLLLLLCRTMVKPKVRPQTPPPEGQPDAAHGLEDAMRLGADLAPLVRRNFRVVAGAAFVGGLVLGISPRARRALRDAVRDQL